MYSTAVTRGKDVLCVLAHPDDESIFSTRISRDLAARHRVFCVYLTDGGAGRASPEVRERESRRMLGSLGVGDRQVFFPGIRHGIPDGGLPLHLTAALGRLEEAVGAAPVRRIYTPAYEGGHQDHDAAHLIALAFASQRGLLRRTWQVPFYHGRGTPWKLFRTHDPLESNGRRLQRRLAAGEALRHTLLVRHYTSQWRTWLGLLPGLAWRRGVLRREWLQPVDPGVLHRRPHPGPLLYERLFGFSYETFREAAERELGELLD